MGARQTFASPYSESTASLWLMGCQMIPCARSRRETDGDDDDVFAPMQLRRDAVLAPTSPPAEEQATNGLPGFGSQRGPLDKEATEKLIWGDGNDPLTEKETETLAMFREQRAIVRRPPLASEANLR